MTTKKYELLKDDTVQVNGRTLYRVRALCEFNNICEGEEGGYIEAERNLSHEGNAWVAGEAKVFEDALVTNDALVRGSAIVRGNAAVCASAEVYGQAEVYGKAHIGGRSHVRSSAHVFGQASIGDDAQITYGSHVYGNARVEGRACIRGGNIYGSARVEGGACVHAGAEVCGTAILRGDAVIRRYGSVTPFIADSDSWMTFNNVGSENGVLTVYLSVTGNILCTRGCFTGTNDDFLRSVQLEHGTNHIAQEYALMIQVAFLRLTRRPSENLETEMAAVAEDDEEQAHEA